MIGLLDADRDLGIGLGGHALLLAHEVIGTKGLTSLAMADRDPSYDQTVEHE